MKSDIFKLLLLSNQKFKIQSLFTHFEYDIYDINLFKKNDLK